MIKGIVMHQNYEEIWPEYELLNLSQANTCGVLYCIEEWCRGLMY